MIIIKMWAWRILLLIVIFSMDMKRTIAGMSGVPCSETVTHNSYVVAQSNDSVEYNCLTGYVQTAGNRHLICNSDGFWNDTELICKMPCDKTVTHNSMVISLSNVSVIYLCELGFYQATGSSHLNCSEDGYWNGSVPICLPIDCGEPVIKHNVQTNFSTETSNTGYGAEIEFVCDEGYLKKGKYWGTYECSGNQQWGLTDTNYYGNIVCHTNAIYMGCYALEDFIATSEIPQSAQCSAKCLKENARFVGLSADKCFCGDTLNGSAVANTSSCNVTCPSTNRDSPYYCGGPGHLLSVYLTRAMEETLPEITKSFQSSLSVEVYGNKELTCKQLCSTEHAYYAVLTEEAECLCTNITYIEENALNSTDQLEFNATMYNLAKYGNRETSCSDLFSKHVRNNGWYYLRNKEDPEYCMFADDTPCENGWVGFAGSCYWFETSQMDFNDSLAHCLSINSSLASLDTENVMAFAREFIVAFAPDHSASKWRFGATDFHMTSSFIWLDGNLSTKSFYKESYPSSDSSDCLYLYGDKWMDKLCTMLTPFVCRRDPEMFKCVEFDIDGVPDVGKFIYSSETMYRQMCIQVCDGHRSANALLQGVDCICTNMSIESSVTSLPESACEARCPGNTHQICGGSNTNVYSFKKSLNLSRASNCQDLENQGLGNITVMLSEASDPTLCPPPECPFSWVKRPGYSSCYKFAFTTQQPDAARAYCTSHGAHLVTFDDPQELPYLKTLYQSVDSFPPVLHDWSIGYRATQRYSPYIRSAIGTRLGNFTILEYSNSPYIYLQQSFAAERNVKHARKFICEKSPEYLGSFIIDPNDEISLSSLDMTIQLCVEICRVNNKTYSLLSASQCRCKDTPPDSSNIITTDLMACANFEMQVCGKSGYSASIYKTDEYPLYESCLSLYENGIRQHGLYQLTNGLQYCQFFDNSTTCEQDWMAWNGTCLTVIHTASSGYGYGPIQEWRSTCGQKGGRLVTIDTPEKHQFIAGLLMGSQRLIVPEVLLGYSESVLLGTPTWASGSLSGYMQDTSWSGSSVSERVLFQNQKYLNTFMSFLQDLPAAEAAICETEKDFIGVFKQPVNIEPVIFGYGLMTLTQCKQACIGGGHDLAMVGRDSCWCSAMTDLNSLVPDLIGESERLNSSSQTYCLGNDIQRCANTGNVDVYDLAYDLEFPASSCDHLYSNGVFFHSTYIIKEENVTTKQTCGFAANSSCRSDLMYWSYRHFCYKLTPMVTSGYLNAAQCFQDDSLPYLPSENDQLIVALKEMVPAFKQNISVFIGVSVRSKNCHFVSSEGFFVRFCPVVTSEDVNGYTTINLRSMAWEEVSGSHYGICKPPRHESIKCINADSLNGSQNLEEDNIYPMTMSICIQLCLGQDSNFSVVLENGCRCYGEDVSYIEKFGKCTACSGHETQMCGSNQERSAVLVNLGFYRNELAHSCEELFSYGIDVPGEYYVKQHNRRFRVSCFKRDPSLSAITNYTLTPSSLEAGFSNQGFKIHAFTNWSTDSAWRPAATDTQPFLHFTFSENHILTAIQIQGDVLTDSWVETYQLTSKVFQSSETYVINGSTNIKGNIDRYGVETQFLPIPKITSDLKLFPISAHGNISLRFTLYGQPLFQFNHSNRYLGCFLDAAGEFVNRSIVSSEDACKSDCQSSYQFYSVYIDQDSSQHCLCGNSLYTYGTSDVTDCRPSAESAYLPVYRAYDSYCQNRSEDHASFLISNPYPYGDFPTFTVRFYYMCDEGFVLSDNTKIKRVTCTETNGTYYWKDNDGPCQVLNCSSLSGPDTWYEVSTDNVTFGTIVTVTCNNSLFMADGNRSKTLTCLDSVQWNDTVTSCTYPFCPVLPPPIRNGEYEMGADGTHAKYRCHDFYQLTSNTNEEMLSCLPNQEWQAVNFSCEINDTNVLYRQGEFDLFGHFMRQQNGDEVILSYISTSLFTCTDRCLKNTRCVAYSYDQQGRHCVLFNNRAQSHQLVQNSDWKYFELNLLLMQ